MLSLTFSDTLEIFVKTLATILPGSVGPECIGLVHPCISGPLPLRGKRGHVSLLMHLMHIGTRCTPSSRHPGLPIGDGGLNLKLSLSRYRLRLSPLVSYPYLLPGLHLEFGSGSYLAFVRPVNVVVRAWRARQFFL